MRTDDTKTELYRTGRKKDKGFMWTDDTRTALKRTGNKQD